MAPSAVWLDGSLLPYEEAKVELLTHTLHYATGVFEGIRFYKGERGRAVFRLHEHVERLFRSAKLVSLPLPPFSVEEVERAILETVKESGLEEGYIRPLIFMGAETLGLHLEKLKPHLAIIVLPFPSYLGEEGKRKGVRVSIEGVKTPSHILPQQAKANANYLAGSIASRRAKAKGYDEALLLNIHGRVAEGPGENIFIVKGEHLITPPVSEDVLEGITRNTVMELAEGEGFKVEERPISVGELYGADEAFFTGTAAEVVPIVEVDGVAIGSGSPGEITRRIQELYEDAVRCRMRKEFCTLV